MLLNVKPTCHFLNSAKTVKVNVPNNNHYHELSEFEGSFPVVDLNNMTRNHEQHSNWQVPGKKTMKCKRWRKDHREILNGLVNGDIFLDTVIPKETNSVSLILENRKKSNVIMNTYCWTQKLENVSETSLEHK